MLYPSLLFGESSRAKFLAWGAELSRALQLSKPSQNEPKEVWYFLATYFLEIFNDSIEVMATQQKLRQFFFT